MKTNDVYEFPNDKGYQIEIQVNGEKIIIAGVDRRDCMQLIRINHSHEKHKILREGILF